MAFIEKNGDLKEPGQNHNLYLGGTSVTVRGCEIASSLTGHNLKSRAHQNWIEYNFIHDSANRELDLVDGEGNTDAPNSAAMNTLVQPGDIVNVSSRGVYFVGGEVNRPGIYPMGGAVSVGEAIQRSAT